MDAVALTAGAWMDLILLGVVMGVIGQGLRAAMGINKASLAAQAAGMRDEDVIHPWRTVMSLVLGGIAGALAAITTASEGPISTEMLLGFLAAGYAGSDFIEGVVTRFRPPLGPSTRPASPDVTAP